MADEPKKTEEPKKKAAAPPTPSATMPEQVAVGDRVVPSSDVLGFAVHNSGLSVEEWNALGDEDREKRLAGVLEAMNAAWRAARGSSGSVVYDPLNPGKASLRMAQAVTVHRYEKTGERPDGTPIEKITDVHSLKVGANHDVPAWVAEHEFVQDNLEK